MLQKAINYIKAIPLDKKRHEPWTEIWKKDRDFRYAVCVILNAVWEDLLIERND